MNASSRRGCGSPESKGYFSETLEDEEEFWPLISSVVAVHMLYQQICASVSKAPIYHALISNLPKKLDVSTKLIIGSDFKLNIIS